MLDLRQYQSLQEALRDALETFRNHVCLIESDRGRERHRLTYGQFREQAQPLARALQDAGLGAEPDPTAPANRAAILMTNQSRWLLAAYAIHSSGGVLVPLDYKLTGREQLALLAHSQARYLITEWFLWQQITRSEGFADFRPRCVVVTDAPADAELCGAVRWEEFVARGAGREPVFRPRRRSDWACIVYSSGTGGRPKGCVLTHDNYLEQCWSLTRWYPFWPGVRYLSILPTNHAIDFMVGYIGPFVCGAAVVHLRTLRPEFVREAFVTYRITYVSLVPMVLKNLERGLRQRLQELSPLQRRLFAGLVGLNRALTRDRPRPWLSRRLLPSIHRAFGGELRAIIVGGAFSDPQTLQFFYDLGIPVANGYGLTEACTAVTVNNLKPFRADTVGQPLPGVEVRIVDPDADGIGEVAVRGRNVMSHYLNDPELTAETIRDGWLYTGDLGRLDPDGHLRLFGRKKNMIVTAGGKNIYPEDVEAFFEGLPVKEFCIFAANYIWPARTLGDEQLVLVVRPEPEPEQTGREALHRELAARNRRLLDYKRVHGYLVWTHDFPRTVSMKIKRDVLAAEIRAAVERSAVVPL
ncbi:MAG: AMP-binding protein [Acidobacteriia bacterium]|jgi:long-chain acyl-CoA synthetase|nr:AMP-binding protein [Terriglobia bacterium]